MSRRLDQDRERRLEPQRIAETKKTLMDMGYEIVDEQYKNYHIVLKNGSKVMFWPYSGWFAGKKPIKSGRGFKTLLKRLEENGL